MVNPALVVLVCLCFFFIRILHVVHCVGFSLLVQTIGVLFKRLCLKELFRYLMNCFKLCHLEIPAIFHSRPPVFCCEDFYPLILPDPYWKIGCIIFAYTAVSVYMFFLLPRILPRLLLKLLAKWVKTFILCKVSAKWSVGPVDS